MWLLVAGLFAGICYSIGFNAGCDEGEGRVWRRQMRRVQEAQVQHTAEAELHLAAVPAQTIEFDEPAGPQSAGFASYADVLGRSVPPTIAAQATHEEAF